MGLATSDAKEFVKELAPLRASVPWTKSIRPLYALENELPIAEVPSGVVGFVVPWAVEGTEPAKACLKYTLHQQPGGTVQLMVIKDLEGTLYAVGFVKKLGADGLPAKEADDRPGLLFLSPTGPYQTLVALCLDEVHLRKRSLPSHSGGFFDVWASKGAARKTKCGGKERKRWWWPW